MTAGNSPLRLTDRDVGELVDATAAFKAVERGLLAEAAGEAETLPKSVLRFAEGANSLHMLGAVSPALGLGGVKSWLHAGPVAHPVLVLFDSTTARFIGTIEATSLSNLRTAALAGVATDRLAARDASEMALIGSGKLASAMLESIATTRSLKAVRIWSPTAKNRDALADRATRQFGLNAAAVGTPEDALDGASIVGMAARVPQPVFEAQMIARGAHVNAIGITVSGKTEVPPHLFERCSLICTDSVAAARSLSDDLAAFCATEPAWDAVMPLSRIAATSPGRKTDWDVTLYKGMGTGIADLALAAEVLLRAKARGDAVELPEPLAGLTL